MSEKRDKKDGMSDAIEIPEGSSVSVDGAVVTVKGAAGELKRRLLHPVVTIESKDGQIIIKAKKGTKREKKMIGTFKAHIKNMLRGTNEKHIYKLKICSGHFPMTLKSSKDEISVSNFLGEKIPRVMKLRDDVEVKIDGDMITVESIDKEAAGQTAAGIEKLTKVKKKDRRTFQDGIYIIEKDGKTIG